MDQTAMPAMPQQSPVVMIIQLAICVLLLVSFWKLYVKMGKPGWAGIVPIYNLIVLLEIVGKPIWWIILLLIPLVNIVVLFIIFAKLAEKFGKPSWHCVLMVLFSFIYFPILAFGKAKFKA